MSGLLDIITGQLGSDQLSKLGGAIGANDNQTKDAVAAALPVLLGSLAKNANSSPEGAESLARALEKDHDGSILDNLGGLLGAAGGLGGLLGGSDAKSEGGLGGLLGAAGSLLGGGASVPKALDGEGILGHLLGSKKPAVAEGVSKASGIDAGQAAKLLATLAPVVMGALGKVKKERNLDAGGLANMLSGEREDLEQKMPSTSVGGLLRMLDSDGDGDLSDELAKLGAGALGSIFGK
ncbi:MAG: DUF937 domain-containing protein [Rhodothermales bacterium]|nr:DUF937 domain-containing protein [Rhodothermales bacterium]